ncbi:MAG: CCA tRNA nucleotidyltransferase [Desulfurococcales archaeon]|nr:CCA tRNA nucleotidyltransferase [Desulfurococcales archaeon]
MTCGRRGDVEESVLSVIKPSQRQLTILGNFYRTIYSILSKCVEESGYKASIMPVGSFAKDTLTSDKWELDVFILFKNVTDDWIYSKAENLLESCLRGKLPFVAKYAQHPYVTVQLMGLEADIVPAIETERPRKRGLGVERTPFHTLYVSSKLDECQKDEVRLLKAFLKGLGIYGAEVRTQGFSGYLSELLVINYGSFHGILSAASSWKPPIYIDPEGIGDKEYLLSKYRDSPLIVVDPVDPERNAAAAVSMKSLATFVIAAKMYLERPGREYFYPFAKRADILAPIDIVTVTCSGDYSSNPPESIWGRAKRAAKDLAATLGDNDFQVLYYSYYTDEYTVARIGIGLVEAKLPPYSIVEGPSAWASRDDIIKYVRKRLERGEVYWINDRGRLSALKKRRFTDAGNLVEHWIDSRGADILKASKCTVSIASCGGETNSELCYPMKEWMTL